MRSVLALSLSLLLKFRRSRPEFKILSNLYGFWEGMIFLNFELLYCQNVAFSFSIFPLVRFITLSLIFMKKAPNHKTKIFYLTVLVLLTINMMIANSIINPLGLSVLSFELCIFFYSLWSQKKTKKNSYKNDASLSEILNFLPIGFIVVKKNIIDDDDDYTIESFNEKAIHLLGVDKKNLSVGFLVSEMKTFQFSKIPLEGKTGQDHSSWTFHEFQDVFKKTDDVSLLRFQKNFCQTQAAETSFTEFMNIKKIPTFKRNEKKPSDTQISPNTLIDFTSRKISHDLKILIKHSRDHSLLYILITEIDSVEELKSKNEQKSRLINSFSHELKTPLNASIPMLEICKQEKNVETNEFYIEKVICCLKLLELALNNILDYSLIMTDEFILNFSKFQLRTILKDINEIVLEKLYIKGLKFDWNLPFEVSLNSDYVRLKQILLNLILNSIQFTEKGSIFIDIQKVKETPLILQFSVTDSGIGIPKEKLSKLIENLKFNAEIPINSTGSCLGLIISNNISILLGEEQLKINSETDKGTTVSFIVLDQNLENVDLKKPQNNEKSTTKDVKSNNIIEISHTFHNSKKYLEESILSSENKKINSLNFFGKKSEVYYYNKSEDVLPKKSKFETLNKKDNSEKKTNHTFNEKITNHTFDQEISSLCLTTELDMHNFKNLIKFKNDPSNFYQINQMFSETSEIKNDDSPVFFESLVPKICQCPEVLIVDDDPFNLFSLEVLLKKLKVNCVKASNGLKALEILQNYRYCVEDCRAIQLILMDYQMPVLDGVETAEKIKRMIEEGEVRNVKIVGCTAFCAKTEVFRMMDSGMSDVIFKPVNIDILEGVLKKLLK